MSNKKQDNDETLQKSDIDLIVETNKKAIEIHTATSEQNEEIIDHLVDIKRNQEQILEKTKENSTEIKSIDKTQFRILILLSTGIISLVLQLIGMLGKH